MYKIWLKLDKGNYFRSSSRHCCPVIDPPLSNINLIKGVNLYQNHPGGKLACTLNGRNS
jgi:hypothetical protein